MGAFLKGYQRRLMVGTAGSTPTAILENATDIDVQGSNTRTDTTTRGDSLSVPIHTEHVVQLNRTVSFKVRYEVGDTLTAQLIAAEKTGADIAIKVERVSSGEVEYNCDSTLNLTSSGPLAGGMELEFEAIPSRDSDRNPSFG
jgi:hypothetical protein